MTVDTAILSTGFRYFVAVAEAGSIRAAAKNLYNVSVPANRLVVLRESGRTANLAVAALIDFVRARLKAEDGGANTK